MSKFEPIKLEWEGKAYSIPDNRALLAIAKVEDIVSLRALGRMVETGDVNFAKIAMAYGSLLRYAGADISDRDVHRGLFAREGSTGEALVALNMLIGLMLPPDFINIPTPKDNPSGNAASAPSKGSSRRPTKRRSPATGAAPINSGVSVQ